MKSTMISVYPDVVGTIDEATKIATDIKEQVFAQHDTVFVVHARECDDAGVYDSESINVFHKYELLNDELNRMQYLDGTSVDVYYATREGVISIMYKLHDSMSYSRYSQIQPRAYESSMWRRFMDRPCRVRIISES